MSEAAEYADLAPADAEELEREAFLRSLDLPEFDESHAAIDAAIDRYMEALAERGAEIERNAEVAERRKAMIDMWLADANRAHERESNWLRHLIEGLADGYDFGKKKSRTLPSGTFGFRSKPGTLEIVDMDAAVAFAEARGLEIKRSVNKTPLLNHMKESGEIPAGTEYVDGTETFFVKVDR